MVSIRLYMRCYVMTIGIPRYSYPAANVSSEDESSRPYEAPACHDRLGLPDYIPGVPLNLCDKDYPRPCSLYHMARGESSRSCLLCFHAADASLNRNLDSSRLFCSSLKLLLAAEACGSTGLSSEETRKLNSCGNIIGAVHSFQQVAHGAHTRVISYRIQSRRLCDLGFFARHLASGRCLVELCK